MCGIAGILDVAKASNAEALHALARGMADALRHRGPDDAGTWADAAAGIALGHRRLSVVDLSSEGHQPMTSASGRFVLVFNGEIYNHAAIRSTLDHEGRSPAWRGHSDTEVMLAAFERWGVDGALQRFNGMFAFALWDRTDRTLHLARDRLGEKPLYYGSIGGRFAFASELKAFRTVPGFDNRVDGDALSLFLRFGYVPAPHSIFVDIHKLRPGTRAEVRIDDDGRPAIRLAPYWDLPAKALHGMRESWTGGFDAARAELDRNLQRSIALRMLADVPVGAFLSGGIDSSLTVAVMQRLSSRPVRTFSIGFDDDTFDEAPFARAVARHLHTDHTELYVSGADALAVVPDLVRIYDEPFADSSQIPTFLVSRLARAHVTVSLSGDGGDELFGGYERYVRSAWLARMPHALRRVAGSLLRRTTSSRVAGLANAALPARHRFAHASEKIDKLRQVIGTQDDRVLYELLVTQWRGESVPTPNAAGTSAARVLADAAPRELPFAAWMMLVDQRTYLPDDILVKVDRAAMAVSLETRVPLLDHEIVEFAWTLPLQFKLRHGQGKPLLRSLLAQYVPPALFQRPKRGFAVPLADWLRGPLRDWAESLLQPQRLREQGYLDADRVAACWHAHVAGTRNAHAELWSVLSFQAWLAHAG